MEQPNSVDFKADYIKEYEQKYKKIIRERYRRPIFTFRRYYDAPDGKDLGGKIMVSLRNGGLAGWAVGLAEICSSRADLTFRDMLFRCGKYALPFMGLASAFTVVTYWSTNIRKVDDTINHLNGGIATGIIYGLAKGRFTTAFAFSAVLGGLAVLVKHIHMEDGFSLKYYPHSTIPSYFTRKLEKYEIIAERRGDWVKESPPPSS